MFFIFSSPVRWEFHETPTKLVWFHEILYFLIPSFLSFSFFLFFFLHIFLPFRSEVKFKSSFINVSVSSWVTQLVSESVHPCGCNFCRAALLLSRTPSVIYVRNFIKNVMRYVYGYNSLRGSWDLSGVLSRVEVVAKKYERTESGRRRLRDAFTAYRVKISWTLQLAWQNGIRTVISSVMNMQVIFLFLFLLFPFLFFRW